MQLNRKQLLDRRALRSRKTLSVGPQIFLVVFVGSIGAVWLLALAVLSLFDQGGFNHHEHSIVLSQGVASTAIDLWPSDRQSSELLDMLVSCLPEQEKDETCRQQRLMGPFTQQIAVARAPGVFGSILQQFVEELVKDHPMDNDEAELIPSTHVHQRHSFTKVIRFAVLPILLEAADLALATTDTTFTPQQLTVSDLEDIVRLLIHWHCRLSDIANDTALLTLSAKRILARPKESATEIGSFIGFVVDKAEDMMTGEVVDQRAAKAMARIDECTELIMNLQKQTPGRNIEELANTIAHNEIAGGTCGKMDNDERFRPSRVTKIIRQLLGPESDMVCVQYPDIALCASVAE